MAKKLEKKIKVVKTKELTIEEHFAKYYSSTTVKDKKKHYDSISKILNK